MNEIIKYDMNSAVNFENVNDVFEVSRKYDQLTLSIRKFLDNVFDNYLNIAFRLYFIKKNQIFKFVGYKNIYEYAFNEFELAKTTVKNMIGIADRFCDVSNYNEYYAVKLKEEYSGFGYSQLVELLSVPEIDLDKYTPEMSVRKIRENKFNDKIQKLYESLLNRDDSDSFINKSVNYVVKFLSEKFPEVKYSVNYKLENIKDGSSQVLFRYKRKSLLEINVNFRKYRGIYIYVGYLRNFGWPEVKDFEDFKKIIDEKFYDHVNDVLKEEIENGQTSDQKEASSGSDGQIPVASGEVVGNAEFVGNDEFFGVLESGSFADFLDNFVFNKFPGEYWNLLDNYRDKFKDYVVKCEWSDNGIVRMYLDESEVKYVEFCLEVEYFPFFEMLYFDGENKYEVSFFDLLLFYMEGRIK